MSNVGIVMIKRRMNVRNNYMRAKLPYDEPPLINIKKQVNENVSCVSDRNMSGHTVR